MFSGKYATAAVFAIAMFCLLPMLTHAAPITFDFEGETATFTPPAARTGALTTLTMTKSGLTVTITRPGSSFDIVENIMGQAKPPSWGTKSLDPFFDATTSTPFIVNFSMPVISVSVDMGDYGQDDDDLLLEGYAGLDVTGTLLAIETDFLPGGGFDFSFLTLATAVPAIRSVKMIGGSSAFPSSVFFDNLTVDPGVTPVIPEPSTAILLSIGFMAFGLFLFRPRRGVVKVS